MKINNFKRLKYFKEECNNYFNYLKYEKCLLENTTDSYCYDLTSYLNYIGDNGVKSMNNIDKNLIQNFFKHILSLELSHNTCHRYFAAIRGFHKYLADEKIITTDITSLIELPKSKRKIPEALTLDEINLLVKQIETNTQTGIRDRAIIEVLYSCGLRVTELTNLTTRDIIINEEMLRVFGKGSKERVVPIGSIAMKWLKIYMTDVRGQVLKNISENTVFLNNKGVKLTRAGIWWIINNYAKNINLSIKIHPHIFRHSFATHLLEGGADLRVIQELLGHSSINTTQIYTNIDNYYLLEVHRQCHPRAKLV